MIVIQLAHLLDKEISLRSHSSLSRISWPVFHRLIRGKTHRPDRVTLDKLRKYLIIPGKTRWKLKQILAKRGLTRSDVAKGAGCHPGTVGRIVDNTMQRVDFAVMERLCEYLELDSLEDLLDTGGLLVWVKESGTVLNVETYGESES